MLSATVIRRLEALGMISKQGKRVNGLFRLLENPILWHEAYANIYSNKGAMMPGVDDVTLDGFSEERVESIMTRLKNGTYRFQPVRRSYIPKKNGKKRPLGISSGDDKLVQEVVRIILERIYEPVFDENSYGFRPGRSPHTALETIRHQWMAVKWFVDMDLFMRTMKRQFDKGNRRKVNPTYKRYSGKIYRLWKQGDKLRGKEGKQQELQHIRNEIRQVDELRKGLPSLDPFDEDYRRLFWLTIAEEKSHIEQSKRGVTFVGYELKTYSSDRTVKVKKGPRHTTVKSLSEQIHLTDAEIILAYNGEFRGLAYYYALAIGGKATMSKLQWIWETSLLKTLANKHKTSVNQTVKRLKTDAGLVLTVQTEHETRSIRVFRLKDLRTPMSNNPHLDVQPNTYIWTLSRSEVMKRLNGKQCEYCETAEGPFEVHHIRKLKDVAQGKELWQQMMAARHRKTLILCQQCHHRLPRGAGPCSETFERCSTGFHHKNMDNPKPVQPIGSRKCFDHLWL